MPDDIVITVANVCAGYEEPVLENITFSVRRGEIFVILGGSGCGKSTLLKHMAGLTPPLAGEIRLMGDTVTGGTAADRARALRHFGMAYQSGALFGAMTLLENVSLPLEAFTDLPRDARALLAEMKLELVLDEQSPQFRVLFDVEREARETFDPANKNAAAEAFGAALTKVLEGIAAALRAADLPR